MPLRTISALASGVWLLASPALATTAQHMTAAVHASVDAGSCTVGSPGGCPEITQGDLDAAFFFGTIAIAHDQDRVTHPEEDLRCDIRLAQRGHLGAFGSPLSADGIIDQDHELADLENSGKGFVLVVNDIFTCGSENNPFAWGGCATVGGGKPFVMDNEAVNWTPPGAAGMPGVVLAHEFGHVQGLFHANSAKFIMSSLPLGNDSVALAPGQCSVFQRVQSLSCPGPWGFCTIWETTASSGTLPGDGMHAAIGPVIDLGPSAVSGASPLSWGNRSEAVTAPTAIEALANTVIADSLPMQALGKYDQADVGALKELLRVERAVPKTALALIGLLSDGNVDDVAFLAKLVGDRTFVSRPAAAAALGLVAARHQSKAALAALGHYARSADRRGVSSAHLGLSISGSAEAEQLLKAQQASGALIGANRRIRAEGWEKGYRKRETRAPTPELMAARQ